LRDESTSPTTVKGLPSTVGLLVSLGSIPAFNLLLGSVHESLLTDPSRIKELLFIEWILTIILFLIILRWERVSLSSIGIKKTSKGDIIWGMVGFLVGVLSFIITAPIVVGLGLDTTGVGIERLTSIPILMRITIVLTAGVTEEILFRGYPIERLYSYTGSLPLSAIIPYLVFVTIHIPLWGVGASIQIGAWALAITLLYVKRRTYSHVCLCIS